MILDCARREFSEYCDPLFPDGPDGPDGAVAIEVDEECWKDSPELEDVKNGSDDDDAPENSEFVCAAADEDGVDRYDAEWDWSEEEKIRSFHRIGKKWRLFSDIASEISVSKVPEWSAELFMRLMSARYRFPLTL